MKNCKECTHPGRDCIPNLMILPPADMMAWCKARKETLHLSNEDIAERTNIPKSTVDRIFSPKETDCRFTTMQPIIRTLAGCSEEELDCDAYKPPSEILLEQIRTKEEIIRALEEETKRQDEHIKQLQATAQADLQRAKDEEAESLAYMKKKEKGHVRAIYILAIMLALMLMLTIAALVVDRLNPNIGFFWLRSWLDGENGTVCQIARVITSNIIAT